MATVIYSSAHTLKLKSLSKHTYEWKVDITGTCKHCNSKIKLFTRYKYLQIEGSKATKMNFIATTMVTSQLTVLWLTLIE